MFTNDYIEIVNDQTKKKSYMYSTVKIFQNFLKQNLLICDTLSLIERWGEGGDLTNIKHSKSDLRYYK